MMKMKYSKIVFFAVVLGMSLAAAGGFAAVSRDNPFCKNIAKLSDRIAKQLEKTHENILARQAGWQDIINKDRESREARLTEAGLQWDGLRARQFTAMLDRADTGAKKKAVADFQLAVETAVKAKREAFDAAKDQYRKDLDILVGTRRTKIEEAANAYKAVVETALTKAKADCAAGGAEMAAQNFKSEMKAAKEKFQTKRNEIDRLNGVSAKETRNKAIKEAQTNFQASLEKARQDLKIALKAEI